MTTHPAEPSSSLALLVRVTTDAPVDGHASSGRPLRDRTVPRAPTPSEVRAAARCEPLRPAPAR